jgi:hypothetical protein
MVFIPKLFQSRISRRVQENLSDRTIETHLFNANVFLRSDIGIDDFV